MFDELYTDRLYIRKLNEQDASFIFRLLNTPGWIRFIGERSIRSIADAEDYIKKISSDPNVVYWTMITKASADPVGVLTFIKRSYLEHHDLGFAALPEYFGQGLVREGCEMLISEILSHHQDKKILATVFPENVRSIGLLGRLGFTFRYEHVLDGKVLLVYGLLNLHCQSTAFA